MEDKHCEDFGELAAEIGGIQAAAFLIERPVVRYMTDLKGRWVKLWSNEIGQAVVSYELPDFS